MPTAADDPLARLNGNLQRLGHAPIKWTVQPSTSYHVSAEVDQRTLQLIGGNAHVYNTVSSMLQKGKRSVEAKKAKRAIAHALSGALEMVKPSLKNSSSKKRKRGAAQEREEVEEEIEVGGGVGDEDGDGGLDDDEEEDEEIDTSQQRWPQGAWNGRPHPLMMASIDAQHARWLAQSQAAVLLAGEEGELDEDDNEEEDEGDETPQQQRARGVSNGMPRTPLISPMDAQHARWLAQSRAAVLLAGEDQSDTRQAQPSTPTEQTGTAPTSLAPVPTLAGQYMNRADWLLQQAGGIEAPPSLESPQQQGSDEEMIGSQQLQQQQRNVGARGQPLNTKKSKRKGTTEKENANLARIGMGSGFGTGQPPRKRKRTINEADVAAERTRKNMRRD